MDVANRLAQWKEQTPEQWLTATNRYLPTIVTIILVLVIAERLAALTWMLAPGASADAPAPEIGSVRNTAVAATPGTSFEALENSHLFGEAPKVDTEPVVVEQVVDAPDTTLNLVLNGVQARDDSELGEAIISSGRSEQKTYFIGDTIDGANGATLHSIFSDRVILNRSGRLETLRLPEESTGQMVAARPQIAPPQPAASDSSLREVIGNNASRITEIIRLSPHLEEGQMVGFRITPGRNRDAFTALGLEPGDVVTDVNGMVVNDPQGGLRVLEALGETTMANVTVLRNGSPQVIVIDTTQLESLAENLQ